MGTWNVKIDGNDTFQDIYQRFLELYNGGQHPDHVSNMLLNDYEAEFKDVEDRNNSIFALALAQWETKSLNPKIHDQVKEIIEKGQDLELWRSLGADTKILDKRKVALDKFLAKISSERAKPRRRSRPKFHFNAIQRLTLPAPDGLKTFGIIESYVNGEYESTSSAIMWAGGGGSVFNFNAKGKFVTARWIDGSTLEIRHDKTISFNKRDESFYFSGDQGVIRYLAE